MLENSLGKQGVEQSKWSEIFNEPFISGVPEKKLHGIAHALKKIRTKNK